MLSHNRHGKRATAEVHPAKIAGKKAIPEAVVIPMTGRPATRYPVPKPPICHPCPPSRAVAQDPKEVPPDPKVTEN